jgi:diguanylate cyclase (GGDEF)-like protein/PAS domain S-box-containing protein
MDTTPRHFLGSPLRRACIEWLALGAMLLACGLLGGWFVAVERERIVASETARLSSQARIIDENLRHQLEGVRSALLHMRGAWRERERGLADWRALVAMKEAMPGVRALLVQDRDGRVLAASDSGAAQRQRLSAAPPAAGRDDALAVTRESGPDGVSLVVSMAADEASGGSGARGQVSVAAVLDPGYFDVVMRSVLYAADMRCAVTDADGALLMYAPPDERSDVGDFEEALPAGAVSRHRASGQLMTALVALSRHSTDERLVVQRGFAPASLRLDQPLTVVLSRSVDAMNQPWQRLMIVCAGAWLLVAAASGGALAVMQRRRRLLHELRGQQAQARAEHADRLELALGGADLGLWDWHIPSGRRIVSARGGRMLGYEPHELPPTGNWLEHVHPDDIDLVHAAQAEHMAQRAPAYEAEYRMRHKDGSWIWVQSRGKVVERDAAGRALRMVGTRMDITERKLAEAQIAHLAFYDGLTNLPNRRLLLDRLGQAIAKSRRNGQQGAVLFLDLDNFKRLNDTLGHDMGDQLLREVGARLLEVTRDADTVGRLGGDEFVILLENLGRARSDAAPLVEMIAAKILRRLGQDYQLGAHEVHSTPSIGATLFGEHADSLDELMKQADMAMYEAKAAGRNTLRFFDPAMQRSAVESARLEADLRQGLFRREMTLHYQPIVGIDNAMTGVEALVRWRHPQRGMVGPDEFIPLAEKTGLIVPLGLWVLETACQQLKEWAGQPAYARLSIAVNVSARQFRQGDFVAQVIGILNRSGADPRLLKLELTESSLLNDIDDVITRMAALKVRGICFALDDFGTGYSSLNYLKRLPISQLKIDQSFVRDVLTDSNDAAIARAVVALAHSLGLQVVAEGVETEGQRAFLIEHGCRSFQGYLFGRPGPVADLARQVPRVFGALVA